MHIVKFSGGVGSALCAVEVVRRFGRPLKSYKSEFDLYLKYGIEPNENINPLTFWQECNHIYFKYGNELFESS